ncbi:hypothetical protein [Novipirellula artificiosorum]|uniref:Uncharacterized protein n=1 Tax=Novipirellula artificiosorum TaxID=2528016 RepID=A0A5C6DWA4_9BACT|nr:hypothetical protein [Novipirellula artificiosorum]TWU39336.1 hypothetical protein Poly41_21600 [Novipirellula artificiosorum]
MDPVDRETKKSDDTKKRPNRLLRSLPLVCILLFAVGVWAVVNLQRGIHSSYYEWGVTNIIVSYAEEHGGQPPAKWDDLVGYEYFSPYLPDPKTIDAAKQNVRIDFEAMKRLHDGKIDSLDPSVVHPIRGFAFHWINPGAVLKRYFQDGTLPHGSFNREMADEAKRNAELYPIQ